MLLVAVLHRTWCTSPYSPSSNCVVCGCVKVPTPIASRPNSRLLHPAPANTHTQTYKHCSRTQALSPLYMYLTDHLLGYCFQVRIQTRDTAKQRQLHRFPPSSLGPDIPKHSWVSFFLLSRRLPPLSRPCFPILLKQFNTSLILPRPYATSCCCCFVVVRTQNTIGNHLEPVRLATASL